MQGNTNFDKIFDFKKFGNCPTDDNGQFVAYEQNSRSNYGSVLEEVAMALRIPPGCRPVFLQDCMNVVGLKQMVNLLSGYPDASICGYPTDSDIITLV